jgi:hypothetical protein
MNSAAPAPPPPDLPRLLDEWAAGIRIIHIAHTRAAADFARWERWLGLSVAVITAITGSTVFASAGDGAGAGGGGSQALLFIAGAFTIAAAVAAAAHTFLGFGALASQHAAAARDYGVLRKEFEAALACRGDQGLCEILEKVRTRWGEIEAKYPFVSQKRYAVAQQVVAKAAERRRERQAAKPAPTE